MNPFIVFIAAQVGAYVAGKFVVDKIANKPKIKNAKSGDKSVSEKSANQPIEESNNESKDADKPRNRRGGDSHRRVHGPGTEKARLPVTDERGDETAGNSDTGDTGGNDGGKRYVLDSDRRPAPPEL